MRLDYGYSHTAYESGIGAAINVTRCLRDSTKCGTDSPEFVMKENCLTSAGLALRESLMVIISFLL